MMAVSELQVKERMVSREPRGFTPDTDPLFYTVPCAGVKYYTFDYRPALRKMAQRWDREREVPTVEVR